MTTPESLISTRFRALVAVVLTGWYAAIGLHVLTIARPHSLPRLGLGMFQGWAGATFDVAFYGYFLWLAFIFALAPLPKAEKGLWLAIFGTVLVVPAGILVPRIASIVDLFINFLLLTAFLAAMAILVSFYSQTGRIEPSAAVAGDKLAEGGGQQSDGNTI